MIGAASTLPRPRAWWPYAATVVLATVAPTLFVLSQNWYAVHSTKALWLVGTSLAAGLVLAVLLEMVARALAFVASRGRSDAAKIDASRNVVFPLIGAVILSALLFRTLQPAMPSRTFLIAACVAFAVVLVWAYARGGQRIVNTFLAILSLVAASSWAVGALTAKAPEANEIRQEFETAKFKTRPNIYLFIYDAYGSRDVYERLFHFGNDAHYAALEQRGFKVLHTFSNYTSTWHTTTATFIGAHHYFKLAYGNDDTRIGRPMMAMMSHNPVLETLKSNGYRLQQIHGMDYFVNELGRLDYIYPDVTAASALRIFDLPILNKLGGRKRRVSLEAQTEALYARIPRPPSETSRPWFTFAHVNIPAHAPGLPWLQLGGFEQTFRENTKRANAHMLKTVDRIKAVDPEAIIVIFGDHGARRYNDVWGRDDPNEAFKKAGVTPETVTLDQFGIMIAVHPAGRCADFVYPAMTPVNIMRTVFACLAEDPGLVARHAADISLFAARRDRIRMATENGRILPSWQPYSPKP
jgi:hypothetical protein